MRITVVTKVDGPVHPWWINSRNGDDREFMRRVADLPREYANNDPWSRNFRPLHLSLWRHATRSLGIRADRYRFMLDLIETDDGLWLNISN